MAQRPAFAGFRGPWSRPRSGRDWPRHTACPDLGGQDHDWGRSADAFL